MDNLILFGLLVLQLNSINGQQMNWEEDWNKLGIVSEDLDGETCMMLTPTKAG